MCRNVLFHRACHDESALQSAAVPVVIISDHAFCGGNCEIVQYLACVDWWFAEDRTDTVYRANEIDIGCARLDEQW